MRKNRFAAFALAVACAAMLLLPAAAAEPRASDQLSSHSVEVTTSPGTIDVEFTVTGKYTMNKIGCESIKVFEKTGTRWTLVESLHEDDEGMSRSHSVAHMNMIYCDSEPDVEYRVVVTIYAENDAGRDTRSKTFYVTGE